MHATLSVASVAALHMQLPSGCSHGLGNMCMPCLGAGMHVGYVIKCLLLQVLCTTTLPTSPPAAAPVPAPPSARAAAAHPPHAALLLSLLGTPPLHPCPCMHACLNQHGCEALPGAAHGIMLDSLVEALKV